MKNLFRFNLIWLPILLVLFTGVGCGAGSNAPDPTQPETAVESEESEYILGKWEVNDGIFGHKIFDFQADGRLQIDDVETGEIIEMRYQFVTDTSLLLTGYDEFSGSATIAFFADKMDLTITLDGNIFAELYVFTRVPEGVR
ncbi:hypothetical protein [Candidatus Leptofilum sp.]|uniref:hypothetical protein n=1 Tax=Candidatus Leptofilum sp. TaxID=3241576 RepID=UPI003B5ABA5E